MVLQGFEVCENEVLTRLGARTVCVPVIGVPLTNVSLAATCDGSVWLSSVQWLKAAVCVDSRRARRTTGPLNDVGTDPVTLQSCGFLVVYLRLPFGSWRLVMSLMSWRDGLTDGSNDRSELCLLLALSIGADPPSAARCVSRSV